MLGRLGSSPSINPRRAATRGQSECWIDRRLVSNQPSRLVSDLIEKLQRRSPQREHRIRLTTCSVSATYEARQGKCGRVIRLRPHLHLRVKT